MCYKLIRSGRRRKIIIHVPVKVKQQKHTHTLVKPVHVHHKPTVIKEEKIFKQEIHKPTYHTKEVFSKPVEYHKEEIIPEIQAYKPIYKEEVSHEHLHHHYKVHDASHSWQTYLIHFNFQHVHPQHESNDDFGDDHGNSYQFSSTHP